MALLLMAVGALVSCNKDDMPMHGGQGTGEGEGNYDKPSEVEMSLTVKTEGNHEWKENDEISIFFTDGNGEAADGANNNVKAFYGVNGWKLEKKITASWENMRVYAFYPYDETAEADACIVTANTGTDFMYGSCNYYVNAVNKDIHVNMLPVLSYIKVRFRKTNHPDRKVVQAVTIAPRDERFKELPVTGVMDIRDGKIRNTGFGRYIKEKLGIVLNTEYGSSTADFSCMPMMLDKEAVAISVTVSGEVYTADFPQTLYLEQGKVNEINITFNGKEILIESVEIKEWTDNLIPPIDIS